MNRFACTLLILLTSCSRSSREQPVIEREVESTIYERLIENDAAKVVDTRNILIVGDSEACAVQYQVKNVKLPTDNVSVECKGGTVVQYWGAQGNLKRALDKHPNTDAVIIFLGTNHYGQTVTPPVDTILNLVKANHLKCVWVGNTAVNGRKWKINELLRSAVSPTCNYFDTEAAGISLPDGVHPGTSGSLKWLKLIWDMIPVKLFK